jgi:hypothetical protein
VRQKYRSYFTLISVLSIDEATHEIECWRRSVVNIHTTQGCLVRARLEEIRLALRYLRRFNRSWWPGVATFIIYEPEV